MPCAIAWCGLPRIPGSVRSQIWSSSEESGSCGPKCWGLDGSLLNLIQALPQIAEHSCNSGSSIKNTGAKELKSEGGPIGAGNRITAPLAPGPADHYNGFTVLQASRSKTAQRNRYRSLRTTQPSLLTTSSLAGNRCDIQQTHSGTAHKQTHTHPLELVSPSSIDPSRSVFVMVGWALTSRGGRFSILTICGAQLMPFSSHVDFVPPFVFNTSTYLISPYIPISPFGISLSHTSLDQALCRSQCPGCDANPSRQPRLYPSLFAHIYTRYLPEYY